MKYCFVFLLFAIFGNNCFSQVSMILLKIDTLKFSHRTGGQEIDSLPDYFAGTITLNSGGYLNNPYGKFQNNYTSVFNYFNSHFHPTIKSNFLYSSLPHIGFQYSFGSKGLQLLHADYQQYFSKNFGINLEINRSSLNEMMRNGSYKNNQIKFSTLYKSSRFKNYSNLNFSDNKISQNGGLDENQSIETLPLEFLKINKSNANSELVNFNLKTQSYFNFRNDSIHDFGLIHKQELKIQNRKYREEGFLNLDYNTIYIDSFTSNDQYQWSQFVSSAGVYLIQNKISAEFLLSHNYWSYFNLGKNNDTNEISTLINLKYNFKNLNLSNQSTFNIFGAKNEIANTFSLSYNTNKLSIIGLSQFRNPLPTPFQRNYFSNTNFWKIQSLEKQLRFNNLISTEYKLNDDFYIKAELSHSLLKNNYFFIDSIWRNDTLNNLNTTIFNFRLNYKLKSFFIQPQLIFNLFSKEINFLPKYDFRTRFGFNKKLFEAKKLNFIIALDFSYQTERQFLNYKSDLDLYLFTNENLYTNKSLYKLDFFTAFQIDDFRFYIKTENLNYIWDKSNSFVFKNVPITPFYIRLGLTWDFFN